MLFTLFLLISVQVAEPLPSDDDLQCAAALIVDSNRTLPKGDEDAREGAVLALQFFLGRLTARNEQENWVALVTDKAKGLSQLDALHLVVPCIGRKAQLLIGQPTLNGGPLRK